MKKGDKTGLQDKNNKDICIGDIVEWDDAEGKRTAKVIYEKGEVGFHCFKNSEPNWAIGHKFMMGHFMYANTSDYLTIIESVSEITSASPTSNEGMELSLNPIPSQINNKNNGSGTKPSTRGI